MRPISTGLICKVGVASWRSWRSDWPSCDVKRRCVSKGIKQVDDQNDVEL